MHGGQHICFTYHATAAVVLLLLLLLVLHSQLIYALRHFFFIPFALHSSVVLFIERFYLRKMFVTFIDVGHKSVRNSVKNYICDLNTSVQADIHMRPYSTYMQ